MGENEKARQIAYLSKSMPVLKENRYLIRSRQKIQVENGNQLRGQDELGETFEFEVSYRRFRLKPDEIHSIYPPMLAEGDYINHIPQITLMEDTLPWEQEIQIKAGNQNQVYALPGMFLLVMKKEEGAVKRQLPPGKWADKSVYIGEKLKKQCQEYKGEQEEKCLDVPTAVLQKILPDIRDLPYMAHVRWVEVEDKETRQFVTEGHYSSLIANRVPVREEGKVTYEVFVVGTLGLEEYYKGVGKNFDGKSMVRLGLFYSWEFISTDENQERGSGFKIILDKLNRGYLGNVLNRKMTDAIQEIPSLEKLLRSGYRPFNTLLRNGGKMVAWYKSPLSPHILLEKDRKETAYGRCLSHADAGMAFLPQLGMYDMTDSAAWTLGRLLAMKNQSYLTALFELRLKHHEMEKETWNIHLIRELLYEGQKKETNFDPLIKPLREECSHMVKEAANQVTKPLDNRQRELYALQRLMEREENQ